MSCQFLFHWRLLLPFNACRALVFMLGGEVGKWAKRQQLQRTQHNRFQVPNHIMHINFQWSEMSRPIDDWASRSREWPCHVRMCIRILRLLNLWTNRLGNLYFVLFRDRARLQTNAMELVCRTFVPLIRFDAFFLQHRSFCYCCSHEFCSSSMSMKKKTNVCVLRNSHARLHTENRCPARPNQIVYN